MPEFEVPAPQSSFSNPLPPTPPTPPLPPEPKTNWFKILLLSLAGLTIIFGLVAVGIWYGTQRSSTIESTETPTTETEETEEPADATADWETFSSPSLPVTFKYPKGVYPFGADLGPTSFPESSAHDFHVFIRTTKPMTALPETWDVPISPVEIIVAKPFGDLDEYISSFVDDLVEGTFTRETIEANGFDWTVVSGVLGPSPLAGSKISEAIFQTEDNSLMVYNYGWDVVEEHGVSDTLFNQILSTFQFTTPAADETGDSVYRLEISLKSPDQKPPEERYFGLAEYLQEALDLPRDKKFNEIIKTISYDTREGTPYDASKYDFNYYLTLKEGEVEVPKIYEDDYTVISASRANSKLEPYIDNSDYCKLDSDCSVRYSFCTYGSFNYYDPFADVWGCGPPGDESGYTFDLYDEEMGCVTEVTYDGSKCVKNKCVAQNRKVFCSKDE